MLQSGSERQEELKVVQESWEDTVEKLVILSFMDLPDFQRYMENGIVPIKDLGPSNEDVRDKYKQTYEYYSNQRYNLLKSEIMRIPDLPHRGIKQIPLEPKLKQIEESSTGEITVGLLHSSIENSMKAQLLYFQIQQNIEKKMQAGISQSKQIQAMQSLGQNKPSTYNMKMLERLVTEANYQLQLNETPEHLKKLEDKMQFDIAPSQLLRGFTPKKPEDEEKGVYLDDPESPAKPMTSRDKQVATVLLGGENAEIDYKGKSIEELKQMGFTDEGEFQIEFDERGDFRAGIDKEERIKFVQKLIDLGHYEKE